MKAIIYAGISLFSVATVYGVADYYSSKKSGALDSLYREEEVAAPSEVNETTTVIPVKNTEVVSPAENTITTGREIKKKRSALKEIKAEDFSRAKLVIEEEPVGMIKEEFVKKYEEKPAVKGIAASTEPVVIAKEPERKLSLDKFSRAPLKKMPREKGRRSKFN